MDEIGSALTSVNISTGRTSLVGGGKFLFGVYTEEREFSFCFDN